MSAVTSDLVGDFLAQSVVPLYIGGEWQSAASGDTFDVLRPSDGQHLATVAAADDADVDAAVRAAASAFTLWAELPANDRAVLLHRLADLIDAHTEEIAHLECLDVGKPVGDARAFDVPFAAEAFRYFADLSVSVRRSEPIALKNIDARQLRLPYGVCGFIFPWNFPFLLLAWGIAPALAAGNTTVVKPAELTPLTTLLFCRLADEAGIPDGVINVIPGFGERAGAALSRHPGIKRISFTGSPQVGRAVAQAAAANLVPSKLELGGKGAAVVFDDVDVKSTAESLAAAITLNAGQVCCTATRWIVHRAIFDELVEHASGVLSGTRIGSGAEEGTEMGPLVSAGQRERVLGYLETGQKEGATFLLEGGPVKPAGGEDGFYVSPALLTGPQDNVCANEEIFGPVAYVLPFEQQEQAIELVNRSSYGLANSVWSSDLKRADAVAERLVAGNSWINAHNVFAYGLPYGGVNVSGMGGGVNSPETYSDYLRNQTIARPLA